MKILLFFTAFFSTLFAEPYFESLKSFLRPVQKVQSCFSGIKGVDRIYYINLSKAKNRDLYMKNLGKEHGLFLQRFEAVSGWELSKHDLKFFYLNCIFPNQTKFSKSPGMIGCYLSHLSILKDALESNYEKIWILEDDVRVAHGFKTYIEEALDELENQGQPFDVLYTDLNSRFLEKDGSITYYTFENCLPKGFKRGITSFFREKESRFEKVNRIQRRLGAYSVILSRQGIKKILDYFENHKLEYAYDVDINFIQDKIFYQTKIDVVSTLGSFGSTTTYESGSSN